jgi:hypothetical protein
MTTAMLEIYAHHGKDWPWPWSWCMVGDGDACCKETKIGGCCENDVIMRIFQREVVHVGFHTTFCMPPPPQQNESSQIIKW